MKDHHEINYIINRIFSAMHACNDNMRNNLGNDVNDLHCDLRRAICRAHRHVRNYWMVYWFLLGKIFAIAMIVTGIHCVVAYFNKVLPFDIVSENEGLWFLWAYSGWFIGACLITYGIFKLFELTINKWLSTIGGDEDC